eukprot:15072857-Ditylum_brightwellii.AAC.1
MLTDVDHICPHAYVYWRKCWVQPTGFNEVPNEVRMLMEKLDNIIIGESTNKNVKRIFKEEPALCFDNYFSHDNTSDLAGKKGFAPLYTVSHDCLPNSVPAQYIYKKRTENHSQSARCAQFNHPIVMVKKMTNEEVGNTYQK